METKVIDEITCRIIDGVAYEPIGNIDWFALKEGTYKAEDVEYWEPSDRKIYPRPVIVCRCGGTVFSVSTDWDRYETKCYCKGCGNSFTVHTG